MGRPGRGAAGRTARRAAAGLGRAGLWPERAIARRRGGCHGYAAAAEAALDALGIARVRLVGHSLGAIVATALAARLGAGRVAGLAWLSPARGYGADAAQAAVVRAQRLDALARQGIDGLADTVAARLLGPQATAAQHAQVQAVARRLTAAGYAQAVDLLCRSDLRRLARSGQALAGVALQVAAGAADTVTPPEACAALAAEFDAPFTRVPGAGHALPLEQPGAVSALLLSACPLP